MIRPLGGDKTELPEDERLKITEIFTSIQGEGVEVGWPTTFVRLTGCPLRCVYCDSAYAFHGGGWMSLDAVVAEVGRRRAPRVCVTGGEPLAQRNVLALLSRLCDAGLSVSLETSGAVPIDEVDRRVCRVVDIKTPGSGEVERNLYDNLDLLRGSDQLKFVLCDRTDYEFARELIRDRGLEERCPVSLSPSFGQLPPADIAAWVLEDDLRVRVQVQLHKVMWGDEPGR